MEFQLVQLVYWLALSVWLGAVVFAAASAQVVFRTVREADPTLPTVLAVNLEGQHATLLASSIMGNLLAMLTRVQLACAAAAVLGVALQFAVVDLRGSNRSVAILRAMLLAAATALVVYDWRVLGPRLAAGRAKYVDNADNPEIANPAKEAFDRDQQTSLTLNLLLACLLSGAVLFSTAVTPAPRYSPAGVPAGGATK